MGYTGPVQIGYEAGASFTHIYNRGNTFLENIYTMQILFHSFSFIIFTLDTICADSKDKPIAGCKNQLIGKRLRNF